MATSRDIFSISRLNSELRHVLDGSFPLIWVQGEISNLAQPRSGHLYFTLKDPQAQIRCAMFRSRRNLLRFQPGNGDQVLARARVTYYEPRGDCQLTIEHLEPVGEGPLQQAFEQLKQKLQLEGLFDADRKQALPSYPASIGVISSPSGAALHDVLNVLQRRYPLARIVIYPSGVQGAEAGAELRRALSLAVRRNEVEVLILTRGGGSLEDLAAFNDESLARDIATSPIPLVSAVGHEIDFTIADFVADRRAPTPSAAAELVSPDSLVLDGLLERQEKRLRRVMHTQLQRHRQQFIHQSRRLERQSPGNRLRQQGQRLDELQLRLNRQQQRQLSLLRQRLRHLDTRLRARDPADQLHRLDGRYRQLARRLRQEIRHRLSQSGEQLAARARELHAVSPLATLQRGYSIVSTRDGLLRSVHEVVPGARLEIRLHDGHLRATVDGVGASED